MSLVDSIALATAAKLRDTAGPRAGLAAFRAIVGNMASSELRARALLGALGCAASLCDGDAIDQLVPLWGTAPSSGHFAEGVLAACVRVAAAGFAERARELAEAEAARDARARTLYLVARCLEVTGHPAEASAAFERAAERAEKEGLSDVRAASLLASARWLAKGGATLGRGIELASAVDLHSATPEQHLDMCRLQLCAPSRFVRAGALSALLTLAKGEDERAAREAILLAARHADECSDALTPLESDRVAAVVKCWPDAAERDRALSRLQALAGIAAALSVTPTDAAACERAIEHGAEVAPETRDHLTRARAALAGEDSASGASEMPELRLATLGLDAVVAIRRARHGDAARALACAAKAIEPNDRIAPPLWSAARLGLGSSAPQVREAALALVGQLLSRTKQRPPRGFLALARALERAGRDDLAELALGSALAREPGAAVALARVLRARGWKLAENGDRKLALCALRQAKALSGRST